MKFSYSQKLYYKAIAKLLIGPAVCFFLAFLLIAYASTRFVASTATIIGIIAFYTGYFLRPTLSKNLKALDDKIDTVYGKYVEEPLLKERDSAKRGMEGESTVHTWLREICPSNEWSIFPNLVLPGSKSDIDFVLVGKKGIFVFEVKNYSDQLFFTTEDYAVIQQDGKIVKYSPDQDPRGQVRWNAERLESFLLEKGFGAIKAKRALVFPEIDSMKYLGSPAIYLIDNKDTLRNYVMNSPDDPRFTREFCENLVAELKRT